MTDDEIKQRIKYLVEHGGLYDDPLADLRRAVRVLFALAGVALIFHAVEAIYLFT